MCVFWGFVLLCYGVYFVQLSVGIVIKGKIHSRKYGTCCQQTANISVMHKLNRLKHMRPSNKANCMQLCRWVHCKCILEVASDSWRRTQVCTCKISSPFSLWKRAWFQSSTGTGEETHTNNWQKYDRKKRHCKIPLEAPPSTSMLGAFYESVQFINSAAQFINP